MTPEQNQNYRRCASQAKKRPADYLQRSSEEQWEIDKELGILDWDGTQPILQNKYADWILTLEVIRIPEATFRALPEYSATVPTFHENWLKPERYWRCLNGAHALDFKRKHPDFKPYWTLGHYREIPGDKKHITYQWYRPVILCRTPPRIYRECTCGFEGACIPGPTCGKGYKT